MEGADPAVPNSGEPVGPIDAPQDLRGCAIAAFRCGGCMAILYIIMFIAIACAAVLSLFFFR
ncbi:MAG TPA: hypothetical protein VGD49_11815 [Longimicrobiales bacterium]